MWCNIVDHDHLSFYNRYIYMHFNEYIFNAFYHDSDHDKVIIRING